MNWTDWVNSSHSAKAFSIKDNRVYYNINRCLYIDGIDVNDVIIDGATYQFADDGTCS